MNEKIYPMIVYRLSSILLFLLLGLPVLVTGQHDGMRSQKLSIVYQTPGSAKDTIELYDEAAADFDVPDFLARNSRGTVQLNGSFAADHESVHYGFDSRLYSEVDPSCQQFCKVVKSVREAPLFGVATISTDDFEGEEITRVIEGSAAERAGILAGDVILALDGFEIRSSCDLIKEIANHTAIGDTIIVDIDRGGVYLRYEVIMGFKIKKIVMWQPCCNGIVGDVEDESSIDLHVFPNPTADFTQFQFTSSEQKSIKVRLTDLTGRVLLQEQIDNFNGLHQDYLDLSRYPAGMYFLTIIQGNRRLTERLALQKL